MKTERIYSLYGVHNSGKTTTLNHLIRLLEHHPCIKDVTHIKNDYDKLSVFTFQNNKIKVGVWTSGDNKSQIKKGIEQLINENCNIIFCAARTKGKGCAYLQEKFKDKLTWVEQSRIYNHVPNSHNNKKQVDFRNNQIAQLLYTFLPDTLYLCKK